MIVIGVKLHHTLITKAGRIYHNKLNLRFPGAELRWYCR